MMPNPIRAAAGRFVRLALLAACLAALTGHPAAAAAPASDAALLADLEAYAEAVAADLDAFWAERLAAAGVAYRSPELVFYTDDVLTPCAVTLEAGVTTPGFYCPRDRGIYLDGLDHAAVAAALGRGWLPTVVAHEWGHHVQDLLGVPVGRAGQPVGTRIELQADCLAGGWTADAEGRGLIEDDAVDVAVFLLAYMGSSPAAGAPMNEAHGTSEQRVRAFLQGYDLGAEACLA